MKNTKYSLALFLTALMFLFSGSCTRKAGEPQPGTYGYDRTFFERNEVTAIELADNDNFSRILIVPAYQGRVMTSTSGGDNGRSYGWINYELIESGRVDPQFNALGGEERFWLGPEGGPYSIFFRQGDEQVFENWMVPPVIDTENFDVVHQDNNSVKFFKNASLVNARGTVFHIDIERTIRLLAKNEVTRVLGVDIPAGLQTVAYESVNTITNRGEEAWTEENGLLSIWILSMLNPSPETTVFIPYNTGVDGVIVNDEYFGKVPADRLIVDDGVIYFRADGNHRSKIGIPPGRAMELSGGYDPLRQVLTLVWCEIPDEPRLYVNSNWGEQADPYDGDVINSYNDGPLDDGSVLGPFYELETSSPALALEPSGSAGHTQRIMHFEGKEEDLAIFVKNLFQLDLKVISGKFMSTDL
jgi:hypothetical protein